MRPGGAVQEKSMDRRTATKVLVALLVSPVLPAPAQAAAVRSLADFEAELDRLRRSNHIPGISAVVARGQSIVWQKGLGLADIASSRASEPGTLYHLASLTKPFAGTVLLQLVQEGKISLDDPVEKYGVKIDGDSGILVRHLLSHTSEGVPGSRFIYNGDRYAMLTSVIIRIDGKPLVSSLRERILDPLGLGETAPNPQSPAFPYSGKDRQTYEARMATGYTFREGQQVVTAYPSLFSAAAGLVSSATDVAAFSMALDRGALLSPQTRALAWTPAVGERGKVLPYGLGWFTTRYKKLSVVWHYGLWTAISSLIVKVPDQQLTFVVLANSDGLSSPYALGAGKLDSSPWARTFLDAFAAGGKPIA